MKVITWNVNSFRKRYDHITHLLDRESPDILLLQEIRNSSLIQIENYYNYFQSSDNVSAGHAGVAILSKFPLNIEEYYDDRVLVCSYNDYYFISVYVPNGFSHMSSLDVKLKFFDKLFNTIEKYSNKLLILGGDFNVVYKEQECSTENPFRVAEKNKLKQLEKTLKDTTVGPHYTWFHYSNPVIKVSQSHRTPGLGLDKIFCSHGLNFEPVKSLLYYRNLPNPSDHVPIMSIFSPIEYWL